MIVRISSLLIEIGRRKYTVKELPDKYANFGQLAADPANVLGRDYRYTIEDRRTNIVIVAPHGGGIEPGTSELAIAIAANAHSLYLFEGLRAAANFSNLHITSTAFDAPGCRPLIQTANAALAIHGEDSEVPHTFVGGRDEAMISDLTAALLRAGFSAGSHPDPELQGAAAGNVCNIGRSRAGAQLEISKGQRRLFFETLGRQGRQHPTAVFHRFVAAVRSCL